MDRHINSTGLLLIKNSEGCKLKAYPDPGTGGMPWTIGYGSTTNVKEGDAVTYQRAEDLLRNDLVRFEEGVDSMVLVDISDNQFSALVCFSFNVGLNNLMHSTLLKKVNDSDFNGAAQEFLKWNKAAGKILPGLSARREAERQLFLS